MRVDGRVRRGVVVSGHIRGQTNTIPLQVEILYNEYQFSAAFAVASLLALLALVTLGAQIIHRMAFAGRARTVSGAGIMSIEVKTFKRIRQLCRLNNVSLDFPAVELTALLGPSGCGKTTLLRIIAAWSNQVTARCCWMARMHRHVMCERQVGFVFQHYALFKHMTVFENIAFACVSGRAPRVRRNSKSGEGHQTAELVQLDWLADRYRRNCRAANAAYRIGARTGSGAARTAAGRAVRRARCKSAQGAAALAARLHDDLHVPASSSRMIRKKRWKSPIKSC